MVLVFLLFVFFMAACYGMARQPASSQRPLPEGDVKAGPDEIELIITSRFDEESSDLLSLAAAAAPSVRHLYGDVAHSISVVVSRSEEAALRDALRDTCTVDEFVPLSQRI